MRRASILVAAILLLSITQFAKAKDPFEGTTWHMTVTPDDDAHGAGERPFDDTISFKAGQFSSDHFKAKGFGTADFDSDTRRGPLATFTTSLKSDANGTVKWTGTTTGPDVSGDLIWTKADGSALNFTFTGSKKG